jgi:hypothetical protein
MEKLLVVAGIWTMCAACAVIFIRGATRTVARTVMARDSENLSRAAAGSEHAG